MNQSAKAFFIGVVFSLLFFMLCEYGHQLKYAVKITVFLVVNLSIYDWIYANLPEAEASFFLMSICDIFDGVIYALTVVPIMCFVLQRQNISYSQYVIVFFSIVISFLIYLVFNFARNYYYLPHIGIIGYFKFQSVLAYVRLLGLSTLFFVIFSSIGLHIMRRLSKNKETQSKSEIISLSESGDTK
ncbi:hypothetical protein [Photobacterium galatheae]|uniref:Uncharacterized protein n=1 Tax=Photobacterium galatheae TaxID=1654360 RepID=A0A066RPF7_9GAMM|nr:hypothetical protein [Photobacterium galatheae]KDM92209.1 hypothetical protein EA58_06880 [Photobacterium galatheae]MCM0150611.1 hypothetical protein [Photobacterium galatheae]